MAGALSEVGWVAGVLVNRTTGHVVHGHLRVELALSRNEPTVPVAYGPARRTWVSYWRARCLHTMTTS
jgi:hypothetical protein